MKGLLLRLSALDADAAAAVRVIAHFQALLGVDLDAAALVRSTAALAECAAGVETADGRVLRCGPEGTALAGRPAGISGSTGVKPAGRVWLERPGAAGPFDDLVLEWMAIAAGTLGSRGPRAQAPQVADPLLVERVLSGHEPVADRAHALHRLGLDPAVPLRVVAVASPDGVDAGLAAVALFGRGELTGTVRVARMGTEAVVLHQRRDSTDSPCEALRTVLCERERAGGRAARALLPGAPGRAAATVRGASVAPQAPRPGGSAGPGGVGRRAGTDGAAGPDGLAGPAGPGGSGAAGGSGASGSRSAPSAPSVGSRPVPSALSAPSVPSVPSAHSGGVRAGVGGVAGALEAPRSWEQARTALRFTVPEPPYEAVADHDALGPVALLAEIPPPRLREQAEVRALAELAGQPGGRAVIAALAAFCRTGSLRQAAAGLHLHHSSVAGRLARAERALGRGLSGPQDRFCAQLALYSYRLATQPLP